MNRLNEKLYEVNIIKNIQHIASSDLVIDKQLLLNYNKEINTFFEVTMLKTKTMNKYFSKNWPTAGIYVDAHFLQKQIEFNNLKYKQLIKLFN
ncbi:MAG: hypothetical protein ACI84S_000141 [Thalassomonas sp.]